MRIELREYSPGQIVELVKDGVKPGHGGGINIWSAAHNGPCDSKKRYAMTSVIIAICKVVNIKQSIAVGYLTSCGAAADDFS
jgi:hypothetical protein